MSIFPLQGRYKPYRGAKENLRRKMLDEAATAHRIAEHVNKLVANNPDEIQQYMYASIARDLGVTTEEVRRAIPHGGYNGVTFGVRDLEREALKGYLKT